MKAYILPACSTCQRILKEVNWDGKLHDIKSDGVPADLLEALAKEHGSYEALFSRRAMKYKSLGLKEMNLTEEDYKRYMLEEYTFLKRPVFTVGSKSFVGNSKKTIEALKTHLENQ